jgi:tetratricopeptide (TPR) repeat protein
VHTREKRDGLAREAYQLATDVWPQYADAHVALGDLHHRNGRPSKAEASFNDAVRAAPTDPLAWESLGKHQLATKHPARAEITYKRAILKATNGAQSPGLILGLAKAAHAQGDFAACVGHGERAANLAPGFGMARHMLGKCKVAAGDTNGGLEAMKEAARVEPDVMEHHADLVAVLRGDGQIAAAMGAIAAGLRALPGDTTLEMAKLSLQMSHGRAAGGREGGGGGKGNGGESSEL